MPMPRSSMPRTTMRPLRASKSSAETSSLAATISQSSFLIFAAAMREACGVARGLFEKGLALPPLLDRRLALDVTLFSRGGMYILDKIEQQGYDVLTARPYISKGERVRLLLRALVSFAIGRVAA